MADTSQPSLFVKNLVANLLPYFQAYTCPSEAALHAEVLGTLASYGATTRGGLLNAALAIAFGFSALETMAEAKDNPALSASLRLRFRACANGLDRACRQNAAAVTRRLACDPPAAEPKPASTRPSAATGAAPPPETCRNRLAQPAANATRASNRDRALAHLFAEATRPPAPA